MLMLGKLPKKHDNRTLKLKSYTRDLAPPPASCDLTSRVQNLGMMLNDSIGDCTIAAGGHSIQTWTAEVGREFIVPDASIREVYSAVTGYSPNNPSSDQGAACVDVLNYWRNTGIAGHKLGAYVEVNPKNENEVKTAIYSFGSLYLGVALPITAQSQDIWDVVSTTGEGEPGSWGGHCVPAVAYNPDFVRVITWGRVLDVTWDFFTTYCDEAYALLSPDVFDESGKSPEGFDLAALQEDLEEVTA